MDGVYVICCCALGGLIWDVKSFLILNLLLCFYSVVVLCPSGGFLALVHIMIVFCIADCVCKNCLALTLSLLLLVMLGSRFDESEIEPVFNCAWQNCAEDFDEKPFCRCKKSQWRRLSQVIWRDFEYQLREFLPVVSYVLRECVVQWDCKESAASCKWRQSVFYPLFDMCIVSILLCAVFRMCYGF